MHVRSWLSRPSGSGGLRRSRVHIICGGGERLRSQEGTFLVASLCRQVCTCVCSCNFTLSVT